LERTSVNRLNICSRWWYWGK